jgi:hypothetical protein
MRMPDDFVGLAVRRELGAIPVQQLTTSDGNKIVYGARLEPEDWDEGEQFHSAGAAAYELYVICSKDGVVEEVNHRVEQAGCCGHSVAPHGAPAWLFPAGAMFDIGWHSIAWVARRRMVRLLDELTRRRSRAKRRG